MSDSKSAIFLFPGQGAQYPGMGLDLLKASAEGDAGIGALFKSAGQIMGRNMEALLQSDAETLKASDIAQPTDTQVNLAAAMLLQNRGVKPLACAGHSLGEYAALVIAGLISVEDCLKLVAERGKAMQACCAALPKDANGHSAGMLAVVGFPPDKVSGLIKEWAIPHLYAANYNSPRQTVVSGDAEALDLAMAKFKEAGTAAGIRVRALPLQVAGPFHCPLMQKAADAFGPVLEKVTFHDPVLPFYSNVSGKLVSTGEEAKSLALQQITSPVKWTDELAAIQAAFPDAPALEVGPGKALQGLWRDSGSQVPCKGAGKLEDIDKVLSD
jgi:[acyl-carrier-protein] S-malonyltransferase